MVSDPLGTFGGHAARCGVPGVRGRGGSDLSAMCCRPGARPVGGRRPSADHVAALLRGGRTRPGDDPQVPQRPFTHRSGGQPHGPHGATLRRARHLGPGQPDRPSRARVRPGPPVGPGPRPSGRIAGTAPAPSGRRAAADAPLTRRPPGRSAPPVSSARDGAHRDRGRRRHHRIHAPGRDRGAGCRRVDAGPGLDHCCHPSPRPFPARARTRVYSRATASADG